jgi:hypothetical protein
MNIEDLNGRQSVTIAKHLGVSVLDHHYHVKVAWKANGPVHYVPK